MKKLIAIVIFMSLLITGCVSANSLTNNSLRKMLEQDEMASVVDISSITIREIQDLTCDDYNKFVLVKGIIKDSNQYMFYPIFVNTQSSSVRDVHFEAPLTTIAPYFLGKADENETIEFFNRMAECVNQYGIDYFSSTENARDFLRNITGQSGIISIAKARDVITDNFYNVYNSYDKFSVFFERGTAVPKYLAAQASGMVYNWNSILRENVYSVWEASTDKETQDVMWSLYGPPYVMGTIWELAELNGSIEPVGKFQSLADIPSMFDVDTKDYISGTNETVTASTSQNNSVVIAKIALNYGVIVLELYPDIAPKTVEHFIELANSGFYNGTIFHRVIDDFMIQGGGYDQNFNEKKADTVEGEFSANGFENNLSHTKGVISMARAKDMNSATSQFFIVQKDAPYLDGEYAAFGKVIDGLDIVDKIASVKTGSVKTKNMEDVPVDPVIIQSITIVN